MEFCELLEPAGAAVVTGDVGGVGAGVSSPVCVMVVFVFPSRRRHCDGTRLEQHSSKHKHESSTKHCWLLNLTHSQSTALAAGFCVQLKPQGGRENEKRNRGETEEKRKKRRRLSKNK